MFNAKMTLPFPQTVTAGTGKTRKLETNPKIQNDSRPFIYSFWVSCTMV